MKATSIIGLGVVCFVLLAILTVVLAGGWIEDDLAERATDDLLAAEQDWASVTLEGRDVTLAGSAPDADSAEKALEVVSGIWGVRVVNDETVRP